MKIVVASAFETGTNYAHVINTVKHADGFAKLGHDVTIICYGKKNQNWNEYYGLNNSIKWKIIPQVLFGKKLDPHYQFALLALAIIFFINPDAIYTRTFLLPYFTSLLGYNTFSEAHTHLDNTSSQFRKFITATHFNSFKKWITISEFLKNGYINLGADENKIVVLPDAVDLDLFKRPNQVIPQFNTKFINIVYAGHLYDYKGIPTILKAAKLLPDFQFHIIGGLPDDISKQQQRVLSNNLQNVHIYGHFQQKEVPKFLHSADVLLLTHTLNHPAANFTSPVKLAEYLASEVPVVVSDIPALRDWLKDDEVIFTIPDNPVSLADGIKRAVGLSEEDKRAMIQKSLKLAEKWSYLNRCKLILES